MQREAAEEAAEAERLRAELEEEQRTKTRSCRRAVAASNKPSWGSAFSGVFSVPELVKTGWVRLCCHNSCTSHLQ
jgi:hypothetical protein